jgi:Methyltransferase domain
MVQSQAVVLPSYYDVVAGTHGGFGFLSPTMWSSWLRNASKWLCEGRTVAEIGPGYGYLARACLSECPALSTYYAVDVSQQMLVEAQARLPSGTNAAFVPVRHDIQSGTIPGIRAQSVDRLAMINVVQDMDPVVALSNVRSVLTISAELRVTFIRRETQDEFWRDEKDYDPTDGKLYNTSRLHDAAGVSPLGFITIDGVEKAFYRVQKYLRRAEIVSTIEKAGYDIKEMNPITFPKDLVLDRWSSVHHRTHLNDRQLRLLDEWQGFPDAWDVLASYA